VVTGQTNLEKVKAVQWGVEHEADAIRHYEAETSTKVEPCGLLVAPNGFAGASPDGFVGKDTVVEVKCPWRMKKSSTSELCSSDKSFFLFLSGDDTYALKKKHDYYCCSAASLVVYKSYTTAILPHPWNQLRTSLRIPHSNYSSPSQRPSFEHAGLTCYTLLSPSTTFSLFHSELKTYLFRQSYPPP